jgi:hypothetical protein
MSAHRDWIAMSWDDRWRLMIGRMRSMLRTGAQFVIAGFAQDVAPRVQAFDVDNIFVVAGLFGSGCLTWLLTTLADPPPPPPEPLPPPAMP